MSLAPSTYRFSREEYHKLAETGLLQEDDHLELLHGELIVISPIGVLHAKTVRRLDRLFQRRLGDLCLVSCRNPCVLDDFSEPQPDLLLLHPEHEQSDDHPRPHDVHLLVEVADSSLGYDRGPRLLAYASALICEVWIVNPGAEEVEVYRQPSPQGYRSKVTIPRSGTLEIESLPGPSFAVQNLLP